MDKDLFPAASVGEVIAGQAHPQSIELQRDQLRLTLTFKDGIGLGAFYDQLLADEQRARIDNEKAVVAALLIGVSMRAHQKAYFNNRSRENLIAAKTDEALFDKALKTLGLS